MSAEAAQGHEGELLLEVIPADEDGESSPLSQEASSVSLESDVSSEPEDSDSEKEERFDRTFEQVVQEEREHLEEKHRQRLLAPGEGNRERFSVAFSGGGMRAAAFQAGVLWRLAETGRLKDVDYFTAVSGGGYITASFMSHVLGADKPNEPGQVDSWYLAAVARALCRMQRHAGDFVRDCVQSPGVPLDGAGRCPRACDLPVLLVVLLVTIWTNPVIFLVTFILPLVEAVEVFFGPVMRAVFCEESDLRPAHLLSIYNKHSQLRFSVGLLLSLAGVTFLVYLTEKLAFTSKTAIQRRPTFFLVLNSTLAVLLRTAFAVSILLMLVLGIPCFDRARYLHFADSIASTVFTHHCRAYVCRSTSSQGSQVCEDFSRSLHTIVQAYNCSALGDGSGQQLFDDKLADGHNHLLVFVGFAMVLTLVSATILMPCFPWLLTTVVLWMGPFVVFFAVYEIVQFRVLGPITGQKLLGVVSYNPRWIPAVSFLGGLGVFLIFLSDHFHGLWHWYYKHCLKKNFFHGGVDRTWEEVKNHPYCPFVIMTGTVNDFMRPTDRRSISEVSFSALHRGSVKCGYIPTPPQCSLAQTTALTGAGCLDALSLSMSKKIRIRFWLEVLNLGWGDFVLFERELHPCKRSLARRAGRGAAEVEAYWKLHRAPSQLLWLLLGGLFVTGLMLRGHPSEAGCRQGKQLLLASIIGTATMVASSFFAFLPGFGWLMFSPVLRRLQEASRFYFRGNDPPGMLYVTDGGVQDCTALGQLLRRRSKRMLLVLAAADPSDDLGVLRTVMDLAVSTKSCCFFDPNDSRRDVKILLDEFKKDQTLPYLRIGVRYGWDGSTVSYGRLVVLKNRLQRGFNAKPVQPLLTEEEVMGTQDPAWASAQERKSWEGLLEEDLGGFGCCDCCHTWCGNPGRKFPHLSFTGYMWLTPRLFNSLCRLGHAISAAAVAEAARGGDL